MSTVFDIYHQLCTEDRLPKLRQKDVWTALRYLAEAHDTTREQFSLTPEVEATYKVRLREYLTNKGPSTIRNSIQGVGQFLRASHDLPAQTPIPQVPALRSPATMRVWDAARAIGKDSPYAHWSWMRSQPYLLPQDDWPQDIADGYEAYRQIKKDDIRESTMTIYRTSLSAYLGYLMVTPESRLGLLPPDARQKLDRKTYADDLKTIQGTPTGAAWDDLFDVARLRSYVTWHSWRIHIAADAKVLNKAPSKPSARGLRVVQTMMDIAKTLKRPDPETMSPAEKAIRSYERSLSEPRRIHQKKADYHNFQFTELENIALTLMDEARKMFIAPTTWKAAHAHHIGSAPACRFRVGLIIMLGWRVPMRARNWVEALLDTNLIKVNGTWRFHFEGDELKIGERRGDPNVFDVAIPSEVVPYLDEYLTVWRPRFPNAETHRLVFPSSRGSGGQMGIKALYLGLRQHVYRFGGKRFFTHLLRTLFYSNNLKEGVPPVVTAYFMNDGIETANRYYLEVQAEENERIMQDARARQLNGRTNGH